MKKLEANKSFYAGQEVALPREVWRGVMEEESSSGPGWILIVLAFLAYCFSMWIAARVIWPILRFGLRPIWGALTFLRVKR